jgi:hypothetical protein
MSKAFNKELDMTNEERIRNLEERVARLEGNRQKYAGVVPMGTAIEADQGDSFAKLYEKAKSLMLRIGDCNNGVSVLELGAFQRIADEMRDYVDEAQRNKTDDLPRKQRVCKWVVLVGAYFELGYYITSESMTSATAKDFFKMAHKLYAFFASDYVEAPETIREDFDLFVEFKASWELAKAEVPSADLSSFAYHTDITAFPDCVPPLSHDDIAWCISHHHFPESEEHKADIEAFFVFFDGNHEEAAREACKILDLPTTTIANFAVEHNLGGMKYPNEWTAESYDASDREIEYIIPLQKRIMLLIGEYVLRECDVYIPEELKTPKEAQDYLNHNGHSEVSIEALLFDQICYDDMAVFLGLKAAKVIIAENWEAIPEIVVRMGEENAKNIFYVLYEFLTTEGRLEQIASFVPPEWYKAKDE